jgi:hypothetical protein
VGWVHTAKAVSSSECKAQHYCDLHYNNKLESQKLATSNTEPEQSGEIVCKAHCIPLQTRFSLIPGFLFCNCSAGVTLQWQLSKPIGGVVVTVQNQSAKH